MKLERTNDILEKTNIKSIAHTGTQIAEYSVFMNSEIGVVIGEMVGEMVGEMIESSLEQLEEALDQHKITDEDFLQESNNIIPLINDITSSIKSKDVNKIHSSLSKLRFHVTMRQHTLPTEYKTKSETMFETMFETMGDKVDG